MAVTNSTAFIAGIAAGCSVVFVLLLSLVLYYFRISKDKSKKKGVLSSSCGTTTTTTSPPSTTNAAALTTITVEHGSVKVNPVYDDRCSSPGSPGYESPALLPSSPAHFIPISTGATESTLGMENTTVAPGAVVTPEPTSSSAEEAELRASRLKAMRESRQRRKEEEWTLVHQALEIIDALPLED